MYDTIIEQRVPCCYIPEAQVVLALDVVRKAARLLEFSGIDELEQVLAALHKLLVLLSGAGVLAAVSFHLQGGEGIYGVMAAFDRYAVDDFEAVDLSRLQLVAGPGGSGCLQIACLDGALAAAIVGEGWLASLSTDVLEVTQVSGEEHVRGADR